MSTRNVLLLGQSLLLSLVAASLERRPGLRVNRAADWAEASRLLTEQVPDVLIFDPGSSGESHAMRLLLGHTGLLLVGLDVERNQAVLLSWREARALTMQQIGEIVEEDSASQPGRAGACPDRRAHRGAGGRGSQWDCAPAICCEEDAVDEGTRQGCGMSSRETGELPVQVERP